MLLHAAKVHWMGCGASSNRSGPQSSSQPKQTAAGGSKYEIKITETTAPDAETVRFLQQVELGTSPYQIRRMHYGLV
eukprot:2240446-Amphidinium_carterae.1